MTTPHETLPDMTRSSYTKNDNSLRIYLASSWKNPFQEDILKRLRAKGFDVYDFKNPEPGDLGFSWKDLDAEPRPWTLDKSREVLSHTIAYDAFKLDYSALRDAEAVVLLLPCGNDAHMEAAWAAARGINVAVYCDAVVKFEPSLMWKLLGPTKDILLTDFAKLVKLLQEWESFKA